jgi:hypothetical protein
MGQPPKVRESSPPRSEIKRALATLRELETRERARLDFERQPGFEQSSGPNPYRIARHPDGVLFGLLRGESQLTALSEQLEPLASAKTLTLPTALSIDEAGNIFVSSDLEPRVQQFRWQSSRLELVHDSLLPKAARLRALASGIDSKLYAIDIENDELLVLDTRASTARVLQALPLPRGGLSLTKLSGSLLVDCLLDHSLTIYSLDRSGRVLSTPRGRISHDGPIWSVAGFERGDELLVALGGVEDHPLDRTIGSFGYIDSFVYLYRVTTHGIEKLHSINLSEHGVLTPKTLDIEPLDDGIRLNVSGYGGPTAATLVFRFPAELVDIRTQELPPGSTAMATLGDRRVYANPLLDAWIDVRPLETRVIPIRGDAAAPSNEPRAAKSVENGNSKLGEALLFTYLMAPSNMAEGALSRFTCETCHFEGTFDGRTHYTGRGDVHATTKPLRGLFNNPPYFSRALDHDLTEVVHNEFRVAGAGSGTNPWFDLKTKDYGWLKYLGVEEDVLSASDLRTSLLAFLKGFNPEPNPHTWKRKDFSDLERLGSAVFATACERCHQARLVANLPNSRVTEDRWRDLIFSERTPLVWANDEYRRTGVTPYVHELGARSPSLRRIYEKYPYFTNGSARSLEDVLDRARFNAEVFFHDGAPPEQNLVGLKPEEKQALLAFLRLL